MTGYIGVATNISDVQRLERQLLEITDREQARMGQEIHDGLCQQLVTLAFDANALEEELRRSRRIETAKRASRIAEFLDAAISDARQLSRGLFPVRLEAEGLGSALEELALGIRSRFQVDCRLENADEVVVTDQTIGTHLFRIAQEAVNNAVKHSHASEILIQLKAAAEAIQLSVADNGIGTSLEQRGASPGMGLHIMEYRARSIGASFHVESAPHEGFRVTCLLPKGALACAETPNTLKA